MLGCSDFGQTCREQTKHLVDVVVANDGIKDRIESVKELNHLNGFTVGRDGGEAHDVAEVNRHAVKMLWFNSAANFKSLGHGPEERTQS